MFISFPIHRESLWRERVRCNTNELVESKNISEMGTKNTFFTFLRVRLSVVAFSMRLVAGHSSFEAKETVVLQFESSQYLTRLKVIILTSLNPFGDIVHRSFASASMPP